MNNTVIGKQNVIDLHDNAGVWLQDPTTPASEILTKPATNLDDPNPHRFWQSVDATIPLTRLMKDLGIDYQLRAVNLENINVSDRGQVQVVLDDRWARRWQIQPDGEIVTSDPNITLVGNYTFEMWFRIRSTIDLSASRDMGYLGTADSDGNRDFLLQVRPSGIIRFGSERMLAGTIPVDSTTRVDDGQWHHLAVTFNTSADLLTLYLDFNQEDTSTETRATPVSSVAKLVLNNDSTANFEFADARYWNTNQTLTQLLVNQTKLLQGTEQDLELCWEFAEGAGVDIADTTNNHAGTASGTITWNTWLNPFARHDSGIVQRNGPWPVRRFVRYDGATDSSRTDIGLDTSFSASIALWVRIPSTLDTSSINLIVGLGNGSSTVTVDFVLYVDTDGSVKWFVSRYTSVNQLIWATDLQDDTWHRVVCSVDGVDDTIRFYVDGVPHASNGLSVDPFVVKTGTERFSVCTYPDATSPARVDVAGDIVVWSRAITPSDDKPFDRFAPESDLTILGHYAFEEGTGDEEILIVNRGTWGTSGDLTLAASAGTPDWTGHVDAQVELPTITGESSPVYLAGNENDPTRPRTFIERITSAVTSRYLSIDIYDPDNSDGAISIGVVGTWQSVDPVHTRQSGGSTNETIPVPLTWTPSSVAVKDLGTSYRNLSVRFDNLNQAEVDAISHWVRSAMQLRSPMFICLALDDEPRVYWPSRSVYGIPVGLTVEEEWLESTLFSLEITLRELAV